MTKSKKDQVIEAIRKVQLEAMDEIDRICRANNINYSLSGGSCLGAIRHGGYIPWDDDIDVDMDRADFEKFREVCKTQLDTDKYILHCQEDDENYHSYSPRLEVLNTVINNKSYEMQGLVQPICVDIFLHYYVPNDPDMRKEFLDKIYKAKVRTYYKWYGQSAFIPEEKKAEEKKYVDKHDYQYFKDEHNKYALYYQKRGEKTDYIIDTSIIHGNYGGFPARVKDGYMDIKFEDRTYRIITHYDEYLSILYGPNYMEIFPYYKRVSHHKLKRIDLGPYAEKYNFDKKLTKYLLMNLDTARLTQVKKVSLDMMDVLDEICKKHDIKYYMAGNDALYKAMDADEYARIWRDDTTVLMQPEDYEKFIKVAPDELTHFYFLENNDSNENYLFPYSKLKLNYTYFRDRRTFPADVNQGLWINIAVLVNTSNDANLRKKHFEDLQNAYTQVRLKWLYDDVRALKFLNPVPHKPFYRGWRKTLKNRQNYKEWKKIEHKSLDDLLANQKEVINRYAEEDSDYYIEPTTSLLGIPGIKKDTLGEPERMDYLGHSILFPADIKAFAKECENSSMLKKHMATIKNLMANDPKQFKKLCKKLTPGQEEKLNKKVSLFELGMYDAPDYRSGVFDMDL